VHGIIGIAQSAQRLGYGLEYRIQFPEGGNDGIVSRHRIQNGYGAHSALIQWVKEALSPVVKLATHFHPVPRLRKRGAITPLPQYVFTAWRLIKQWVSLRVVLS